MFGKGCDVDSYRDFLKLSYIYSDYISSLEYTDQEISDRYAKDPTEFDYVAYQLYTSAASSFAGKNDDGTTAEITDENRASAKAAAEEMMEKFEGENVATTPSSPSPASPAPSAKKLPNGSSAIPSRRTTSRCSSPATTTTL